MKLLHRSALLLAVAGLGLVALASAPLGAADDKSDAKDIADRAVAFLRTKQAKNGSFSEKQFGPGVTALVVAAMLRNGYTADDPTVKKALDYLTTKVQKDGGIYEKRLANYTTSVAMMALAEANKDKKFDTILKNGADFLKSIQQNDPASKDIKFGGVGYDAKSRPDLSNTQMFLDALLSAGVPKDDPAVKNAMKFISRCQNLPDKEKGNDQPFAAKAKAADKGGFVYVPDPDDEKHSNGDGGLRSLGAMTYAGLKSFLYAGVDKKDPRVQGAVRWIRAHYTLDENPGEGQSGIFYYYHTFAKAMDALGEDPFADSKGVKHDWRKDLVAALKKRQDPRTGSFAAASKRDAFGEGDPSLATAFALLSLSYTKK